MEGHVVSSYLRSKFSSTLKEAKTDVRISSQIIALFGSIEWLIKNINQVSVELLYEITDALSECTIFDHERRTGSASKKGIKYLFRVLRFENKMRDRLDKIEKILRNQYNNETSGGITPDPSSFSIITGFESQVGEIEKLLMQQTNVLKPIGIVGRCGRGKRALAHNLFSSSRVESMFFPRIWVGLSKRLFDHENWDLREGILNHILIETGHDASDLEYGDYSIVQLLERLHVRLKGKRYLIVLDDAWRMDEWFVDLASTRKTTPESSFTHALPKGSGGAVIVTSRAESVIRQMVGGEHLIPPHVADDFCWRIFSDAVKEIDSNPAQEEEEEEDIIEISEGLPPAAKTLAIHIYNLLAQ